MEKPLINVPYAKYLDICEGISKDFQAAMQRSFNVSDWAVCVRLFDLFTHALDVVLVIKDVGVYRANYHARIKKLIDLRRAYFVELRNRGEILINRTSKQLTLDACLLFRDLTEEI